MKTIKKILSIALCLTLVMSYIPMVSLTAFAADGDADEYTVTVNTVDANVLLYEIGFLDFSTGTFNLKTEFIVNESVNVKVHVPEGYVASVTVKDSSGEMISYTRERDIYTFTMPAGNVSVDISAVLCSHPTEAQGYVHSYDDQGNSTHHEKWCNECYSTIADSQEVHTFVNSIYKCDTCGYSNTRLVITEASGEQVNAMNVAPGTALTATLFDSDGGEIEGVTYKWKNFGNILHTGSTYTVPYDMVDSFVEVEAWLGEVRLEIAFVFCAEPIDDCQHNASQDIYSSGNVIAIRCAACRRDLGMTATVSVPDEVLVYTGAEQKVATVIYSDGWQENGNGELEILYEGDCTSRGTHKAIIWYQGVSAEISFKIGCSEHSTTADGDKVADCNSKAYCSVCESKYGDVDLTKHDETVEYENGFCPNCDAYEPAVASDNDGYYEIGNVGNLFWLAEQVNYGSLTKFNAVLTSDLIIPDSKQWMPINLPDGIQNASVFDGNGHSITLNQSSGLFSSFNYSVFRNVILYGTVTANTTGNIGAVVGSAYRTTIQNVISYVDVTNSNGNAGGLAGYFGGKHSDEMYSKIENCAVYADISGTNTGGLIGEGWNGTQYFDIANCTYVGDITGTNAGAIVGYQNTDSNTCVFTNIYWCEADGIGFYGKRDTSNQVYTNTMAKTPEQFASGEVAYLLQQGNTEQVWGQDNNQAGAKPIFDSTGLYKVVTVGETGNYSVANVGDTNGDGTVDVTDYQALVNMAVSEGHSQTETASYDDIVKYDLDGDGYLDVIDAYLLHLFINGFTTVDVYAVGDYDLNGKAFEEADIKAIKHAIENPEKLATYKKYVSDINGDGKLDENDLTALTVKYGEVTGTECADNVKVYYRWGNKYSTCTATAMCTLCGEKVATETVNTTSETLAELTCTQDGKVKYTATFQNELLGTKTIEIVSNAEGHKYNDGECSCGMIQLNIADISKTVYFNDNDNKLDLSTLFTLPDGAGNVTYELVSGSGNLDGSTLNIVLQGTEKIKVTVAETETCSADEFEITVKVEAPKGSGSFDGEWVPIG